MRTLGGSLMVLVGGFALLNSQTPAPTASSVLAAAREALGGDTRLDAVRALTATGRTRQLQGDNLVPIEFEIAVELPDKYVRREEIPARDTGPTMVGFNGMDVILSPSPPTPPPGAQAPPPDQIRQMRGTAARQDFARLLLGITASSFDAYPLTFVHIGEAEAPEGQADVLEAKGPGNFTARFFIHRTTRLPVMVSWQTPVQGKPAETRLFYGDYRDVDGMKFPFRLRRAVGPNTVEETTFDRFRVNPKIDARRFEVRK